MVRSALKVVASLLLGFVASFLLAVLITHMIVKVAHAHGWYKEKTDPVFGTPCCGGTDCASFTAVPEVLWPEADGYRVRMSLEQTKRINPYSQFPVDALVPWNRVQPSEDGNYHICIMTSNRSDVRGGIYCLFVPPNI